MLEIRRFSSLCVRVIAVFLVAVLFCGSGLTLSASAKWRSSSSKTTAAKSLEIRSVEVDSADGSTIIIRGNRNLASSKYYSALKLSNPHRFVIDIPDAVLATKETLLKPNVQGIEKIELSESRGTFYNASRITLYVSDFETLSKMNVSVQQDALMIGLTAAPVLAEAPVEASTPQPVAERAGVIPVPPGATLIEDIFYRDEQLIVRAANNGNIHVKNRLVLTDPSRLVIDFDKAVVSDRSLLKPISVQHDNIRQIRVGQFDEETVRLVVEAASPERIQLVYAGPDRSLLAVKSGPGMMFSSLPSDVVMGQLRQITVNKDSGDTVIRVSANTPIAHRVLKDDGRVMVEMDNIAASPGWVSFERSQFPHIDYIKVEPMTAGQPDSKLVVTLKGDLDLASHLTPDGRTLELMLLASRRGSGTALARQDFSRVPFAARVVIDPGHGGKDQGASREGLHEKDLNLAVALKLKQSLEARGVKVYMTRSTDEFLPLPKITQITNSIKPDLFVSVHTNSSTNAAVTGIETYYYTPQSVALANRVHNKMINAVSSPDRGVRKAMFYVIHHTSVPAILCEMGYISNATERASLFTEVRKQKTADAIAEGVVEYLKASVAAKAR
jgi:N-acetylmuramoyl-L-alanine amidase